MTEMLQLTKCHDSCKTWGRRLWQ